MTQDHGITRRAVLEGLGALGVAAATVGVGPAPATAAAKDLGVHETAQEGLKRLFGGRAMKDGAGAVKLETPLIAENGAVVPVSVETTLPMTPTGAVRALRPARGQGGPRREPR